ncbi:hypothetical protein [Robiginitalea marina]|uniref:Lipocalin-like domain-containing protein n=1 Tax=Robiginitalea marina TaxID=2954105 RepID=A0ABT1AV38_9FLAO|nr:hypothetical protein [Robiginitalea marina]MCO5723218.1 hypothetical protein [Robiginitalea marina]
MKIFKFKLLFLAYSFSFFLLSCSKDNSEEIVYDANNPHPNAASALIGTWVSETDESDTRTFKWDGTVVYGNGNIQNYKVKFPDGYSEQYDCQLLVMEFTSLEGNSTTTTRICNSSFGDFIMYFSSRKKYLKI